MGRSPCCDKAGLKKGPWTPEEDQKLLAYIEENGHGNWRALPTKAGLQRCGKSCRLRWTNYLRPDIKRGKFTLQEEQTIIQLHALLGNRWSAIATHLPKRTDNEIKNYWNTHLKKRLTKMGIDPVTHKPKNDALHLSSSGGGGDGGGQFSKSAANLSHMAQWESARLEAEARLARQSKLRSNSSSSLLSLPGHHYHLGSSSSSVDNFPAYYNQLYSSNSSSSSSSLNNFTTTTAGWPTGSNSTVVTEGTGGGGVHHSPTSTDLSFSENNGPASAAVIAAAVAPTDLGVEGLVAGGRGGTGVLSGVDGGGSPTTNAMIEFMGNNNAETPSNNNSKKSNSVGSDNNIEEAQNWKLANEFGRNPDLHYLSHQEDGDDDEQQHHQYSDDQSRNSISIMPLISSTTAHGLDDNHRQHQDMMMMMITNLSSSVNNRDDIDGEINNANDDQSVAGNFIDSFTELILRTNNIPSGGERNNLLVSEQTGNPTQDTGNTSATSGAGDNYFEDMSKNYWNSILNLVDSSPSSASDPLF